MTPAFTGVGPARQALLHKLGIVDRHSLLHYYPRDYEDRRRRFNLREVPFGEKAALQGTVISVEFTRTRAGLGMASVQMKDASGQIEAVWFKRMNPRYDVFAALRNQLKVGTSLWVYGAVEWGPHGKQIRVEDKSVGYDPVHFDRIVPVYAVTAGLPERLIRTQVAQALAAATPEKSLLPEWLNDHEQLKSHAWALQKIHFPDTLVQKEEARSVLAFEEFFVLETALAILRQQLKRSVKTHSYRLQKHLLTPFRMALPFELTRAQKRVTNQIFDDLMGRYPMNRLVQGDVGSGKTLVALCAMLLAVENGCQAALMAPTEILAEQHQRTFQRLLGSLPVSVELITGKKTAAQRRQTLEAAATGQASILIGTHALIQNSVLFQNLKLVVIDEQHRFGVDHRRLLREKGEHTDMLVMTATPIPRTLALTLYGDLDVSVIDELPPGRQTIQTTLENEDSACEDIRRAVQRGEQAYIVYPLVNESDKVELKAAVREAERLKKDVFPTLRVGLMHGQLKAKEKDAVMDQFRRHQIDILIATSIIEVGIDIPNATVMAIQHAERFGLATLHQLRGRVGRGEAASRCLLISDARSGESRQRLEIMTQTQDGFRLSEEDLKMRGPGEILGAMQRGTPLFRAGSLQLDAHLIQRAKQSAEELLKRDPDLERPEHQTLREVLSTSYKTKWSLGATA